MPKSNIVIDPDGRQVGLYTDDKTGKLISTHSMLKTFRRCPKQAEFKYVHRLKPRRLGKSSQARDLGSLAARRVPHGPRLDGSSPEAEC
jgi:hypothetical protein